MVYLGVYVGTIVAGGAVLLPALYAAALGYLPWAPTLLVALLANVTSDTLWYLTGRFARSRPAFAAVTRFIERRSQARYAHRLFSHNRLRAIFFSKFMFGTRIAVQFFSGAQKVPFAPYLLLTLTGSALWLAVLVSLVRGVQAGSEAVGDIAFALQLSFLGFVAVVLGVQYLLHRYTKDYLDGRVRLAPKRPGRFRRRGK